MISKKDFEVYINDLLKNESLKNAKYLSKKYSSVGLIFTLIGIASFIAGFMLFMVDFMACLFFVVIAIVFVVSGSMRSYNSSKAINYYKDNYRDKILDFLLKGYTYTFDKHGQISSSVFDKSQFVDYYEDYSGLDKLSINIANDDGSKSDTWFNLCDLDVTKTVEDDEGNESDVTVYEGAFGYVDFPFEFKCCLCINSKYKKKGLNLEKVSLEDINFNKKFCVYSDNQIEARYILTPKMMENLLWLQNNMSRLKIVLVDNRLYIGFIDKNLFELGYVKDNEIEKMFYKMYDEVDVILNIVEEIKNNNKIFKM